MDNNLEHLNDPALPKVTSWKQFQALLDSGLYDNDSQVNATFMTQVDCAVCGPIWECGGMVWKDTGERMGDFGVEGTVGALYLADGQQIFLVDDARTFLQAHIDEAHPGWRFVIDGEHDTIRARRCGRKPRR